MALHHELPIYKATSDLFDLLIELTKNFPRTVNRLIPPRLLEESFEMLTLIFRANVARDKAPYLHEYREKVQAMELTLRMSHEKRWISTKQHADAILLTQSMGKQATGWLHSLPASPVV